MFPFQTAQAPEFLGPIRRTAQEVDWAVGWLAREDEIVITPEKRSYHIRVKRGTGEGSGRSSRVDFPMSTE